jgi:hypothetical protein
VGVGEGAEVGKALVGLRTGEACLRGDELVVGGCAGVLNPAEGAVIVGEAVAVGAVARQVGDEAPIVGVAGSFEDVGEHLALGGKECGEPVAERDWLTVGVVPPLYVELDEVDGVAQTSHGALDAGGVAGALSDESCLHIRLVPADRDAEVGDAAAVFDESVRALWALQVVNAALEVFETLLGLLASIDGGLNNLLESCRAIDAFFAEPMESRCLPKAVIGDGGDDGLGLVEGDGGVRDEGGGSTGRDAAGDVEWWRGEECRGRSTEPDWNWSGCRRGRVRNGVTVDVGDDEVLGDEGVVGDDGGVGVSRAFDSSPSSGEGDRGA